MASRARPGFAEGVVVLPSGSEDRQWIVRRSEAFVLDVGCFAEALTSRALYCRLCGIKTGTEQNDFISVLDIR